MIAMFLGTVLAGTAPAATISVRDIVETTDIAEPTISPNGRFVAFRIDGPSVSGNRHNVFWYVVPVDGSAPSRLISQGGSGQFNSAGTLITEAPIWSRDSSAIYFRALINGTVQIWRALIGTSAGTQVTNDPADVRSFTLMPDGRSLVYRVGPTRQAIIEAESQAYDSGVLVDETVDLALGVSGGGIINGRSAAQRLTGRWFERRGLLDDQPEQARVVLLDPSAAVPVIAQATSDTHGRDPVSAGALTNDDIMRLACRAVGCESQTVVRLQAIPGSRDLLVTAQTADFRQSLYRWRRGSGSARLLVQGNGLVNGGRDLSTPCSLTVSFAFCVRASATAPPELVRISLGNGAATTVFDPNRDLRARIVTPARLLSWHDASGIRFTGQLVLPRVGSDQRHWPLVIDYYRCPGFLRGGVGDETPLLPLASEGVAILCINATVAAGRQDSRLDYAAGLSGIRSIVDRLGKEGVIDPRRVGMAGLSFGSEVVMWVARHSSLLAAASIASGQLEPGYYWYNAVRGRDVPNALADAWGLGDPDHDRERWADIAPALDTENIHTPLLMQLPELEARWSMQLYAKLSRSDTPVELYAFPDAAHVKSQPRQKLAAYSRNLDWFLFWLTGRTSDDPVKAGQYARWRMLAARRAGSVDGIDRRSP